MFLREVDEVQRAGDGIRTHEYQLGRLMPYHLATPARDMDFTCRREGSQGIW